jgi:hypothetical protein
VTKTTLILHRNSALDAKRIEITSNDFAGVPMTKEEMTTEAARSMMEHGIESPRRTDLIWKIKVFMNGFDLGHRSPGDLIDAMKAAGLKITHDLVGGVKP